MDVQVSQNHLVRATSIVCRRMSTTAGSSELTGPLRKGRRNAEATLSALRPSALATCSLHSTRPMTTTATRQMPSPAAAATTS
jgi:hypothetical protein